MKNSIESSGTDIITVSLRRETSRNQDYKEFSDYLISTKKNILPNTAGARSVDAAVNTALMARDIFSTNWIKLEITGHERTLQPDPIKTIKAAEILTEKGFTVFPYTTEDIVIAKELMSVGCKIIMPWASPIGSGGGISNPEGLLRLRDAIPEATMIVDAGIRSPSDANWVMENGFDAVLLNTAVSSAIDPVKMAKAFSLAVCSGKLAYEAGVMEKRLNAKASTPEIDTPFWHGENKW